MLVFCISFAAVIGLYDGFIGPGTGTFLIFCLIFAGFDFVNASGNAKVLNMTSNFAALLLFLYFGKVHVLFGLTAGAGQIIGAIVGSRLAIRKGTKLVRIVFISTTVCMVMKLLYEYTKTL